MVGLDWWLPAVGVSGAVIAVLITVGRGIRRRRRSARAPALGERRIEIVAIDERKWNR
jgi:hypothetical protein